MEKSEFTEDNYSANLRNQGDFVLKVVNFGHRVIYGINIFKGSHVENPLFLSSHMKKFHDRNMHLTTMKKNA